MNADADADDPFGIYFHWPFCQARCPYCDFNAHVRSAFDDAAWRDACMRELDRHAAETANRTCVSVFFGGGTPSLIGPDCIGDILRHVAGNWNLAPDAEVTLEANPTSSDAAQFAGYRAAGVNRISIGVQSLRNADLKGLGRLHNAADAQAAFDAAASCFARVSIDLIYGRQRQKLADWREELEEALAWQPEHLSAYQLTIEPGTAFGALHRAGKLPGLPSSDLAADMQEATIDICGRLGYRQYEVSNYARPGGECRHNLIYWRGRDYLGIGPGAHGRITTAEGRFATETILLPEAWLRSVAETGSGELARSPVDAETRAREYLMMSLRLAEGTDLAACDLLSGGFLNLEALDRLEHLGLAIVEGSRLRATRKGALVLDAVLAELLA